MINLEWQRERDPITCLMHHVMYDGSKRVATIKNTGRGARRFEVQINKNSPWHRRNLQSAKNDCEFVYINTKR